MLREPLNFPVEDLTDEDIAQILEGDYSVLEGFDGGDPEPDDPDDFLLVAGTVDLLDWDSEGFQFGYRPTFHPKGMWFFFSTFWQAGHKGGAPPQLHQVGLDPGWAKRPAP